MDLKDTKLSPEDTDKELAKIEKDIRIYLFNTPQMPANPLQDRLLKAWNDPQYKVFVYSGSNKIGKTTIITIIAISIMWGYWPWDHKKTPISKPPVKIRFVGQDWENHIKTVLEPTLEYWWPKNRPVITKKNNQGVKSHWTDVKTGSTLELMSNRSESDLFEGWDGKLVLYDEPPKREIRVACARGLVVSEGRELFGATLLKEPWIDREVIKARDDDGKPDRSVFSVDGDIWNNVGYGITEEGVKQFKKTLRPEEIQARIHGKPAYMANLVCPKFNRNIHLINRVNPTSNKKFKVPLDWIVDISIDFHPSKPWAVLFLATDKRNFKYCVDEIFENGSWKAIGDKILRKIKYNQYRVGRIIIDPLAKGDAQSDLKEDTVYDKMSDLFYPYGYSLRTATKDKDGGIIMINDLLLTENEMPALFFLDDLKRTIEEIEDWMNIRDPKTGTIKPAKDKDDMVENLYRLILLDTQYYEPEPVDDEDYEDSSVAATGVTVGSNTGY